jgi:hypothetical protein
MAINSVKGLNVTPGVYQKETELIPSSNPVTGLTVLGLAGETLKGPAYSPIYITRASEFSQIFGGTSTEIYSGSKYPRYELPYIAKDFLQNGNQLYVTRVLGLSGTNMGKAWCVKSTGCGEGNNMLVAIIRSRGHYVETYGTPKYSDQPVTSGNIEKYVQYVVGRVNQDNTDSIDPATNYITYDGDKYYFGQKFFGSADATTYTVTGTKLTVYGYCGTNYEYDKFLWDVDNVWIAPAGQTSQYFTCGKSGVYSDVPQNATPSTPEDFGTFKLVAKLRATGEFVTYDVSFNPGQKNYIYNVLGSHPTKGATPLFIEELYDVALQQLVYKNGNDPLDYITGIYVGRELTTAEYTAAGTTSTTVTLYNGLVERGEFDTIISKFKPVDAVLTIPNQSLVKGNLQERYLYVNGESTPTDYIEETITIISSPFQRVTCKANKTLGPLDDGKILVVKEDVDAAGKKTYNYHYIIENTDSATGGGVVVVITNGGSNYTTKPTLQITDSTGTGATADVSLEGGMVKVCMTNIGSGYTNPSVTLNGGNGTGATAKAYRAIQTAEVLDPTDTQADDGYSEKYVFVTNQDLYYEIETITPAQAGDATTLTQRVIGDVTDYKEVYRYASTPWVVSQMNGTYGSNDVKKLFRFHTINEGTDSNTLYKISIMNIRPETGQFDVVVRDYNDSDSSPVQVETYVGCSMNPDSSNYVASRIGSHDNTYPKRSTAIVVEVSDDETTRYMFPAGFLGYPVRDLGQASLQKPSFAYNVTIDEQIRPKKQFFGVSEFLGVDTDLISYKGKTAYTDGYFTDGFHLDSRVNNINTTVDGENPFVKVIGTSETSTMVCGFDSSVNRYYKFYNDEYYYPGLYTWQTPSIDLLGKGGESPFLTSNEDIIGTIYEDINNRKFTLAFYGGYDGWDEFRTERTTGDGFKKNTYKGKINMNTGEGEHFNILKGVDLDIPESAISSDFYAFWGGYLTFNNNSVTPVTVFATPGIDLINQPLLSGEAIDIVEEDIQNAIYIATTPDKPKGNGDTVYEMYTESDIVGHLENTEVDSSYVATYYPWARYYDANDGKYIFLPLTRDVIKSIANIDNTSFVHNVPAGVQFGRVDSSTQFLKKTLKIAGENTLYSGRVNFVKSYAQDGNYLWGQKTLKVSYYEDKEPLTRISVRRIMNYLKTTVKRSVKGLLFTPNNNAAVTSFKSIVGQILANMASNGSIYSNYRIVVDDSVEARQARTLPAKIYVMPYNLLEYIEIEWIITPEGTDISGL